MKSSVFMKTASLLAPFVPTAFAQDTFTHAKSGITFWRQTIGSDQTTGGLEWGFALPGQPTGGNDEYIGYIKGAKTNGEGWAGLSHGGAMPDKLLLVAWAEGNSIKTSFNFASGYVAPDPYTGNATLTQINATVTDTNFELVYRCQECWRWNQNGAEGSNLPTSSEVLVLGWATHLKNPEPGWVIHERQGNFGFPVASARNAKYAQWVNDIKPPPPTSASSTPVVSPSATAPPKCNGTPAPTDTYDYIVVGGGAGGIPVADKLSESGKSVLLIERGPPSLARFGGNMGPEWALSNNLTRFDIPGLCNQIWVDSAGVACTDIDQMAGCVLGGGAAVNAALWWKPVDADFDVNFPNGWKSADIKPAVDRVFKRIPGTDTPSKDGKRYKQEGFDVLSGALAADGWKQVTANDQPNAKNRNFAHSPFMYENAQRQGPLGAYLPTALARKNFRLLTGTMARRVVRTGGKATGVELESGYCGTVNLKPGGRVILSAGTFGTSKLLFRSGIGPKDQLTTVKNSAIDGSTMIAESSWINLPVGKNLNDHVNTDLVVRHPNISFYNFYQAWNTPIEADKNLYLSKRSGILATSAPNIGPLAWEVVKGSDGKERSIQWTARVEGPGENDTHHLTISQYLGRGSTSRGALSINGALSIVVSQPPYLQNDGDTSAVIAGIKSMMTAIKKNPKIEFQVPAANQTVEEYVASLPKTPNARRANHWIGTAKIGTDSGLNGGTSVVDLNTKVYGTDNIHVVDASIFPGHIVTNPTGPIVVVAEHAAAKILALGASSGGGGQSSSVKASSTVVPSSVKPATPTPTATVPGWSQCGGQGYTGPTACASGFKCAVNNQWFSQCIPN